ncbi:D-beta-hydroxybutyrate dehydrogenase, mitochondrial-like [Ptychodera flava]|uniref:D-beta-hydroxybutyrate dehydrogenase, mitochondrial-like n=1 Tax=Ptychodera flava TaxID=63121 RepID=UPI00396AA62D
MEGHNDGDLQKEFDKRRMKRSRTTRRYNARLRLCLSLYLFLLGSATAAAAVYGPQLLDQQPTSGWSTYISGAVGLLCMYWLLQICFPRWTWNGYGFVIPIKKAVLVTSCDTMLGYYLVKRMDNAISTVFAGTNNPEGELPKKLSVECTDRTVILPLDVTSDESVARAKEIMEQYLKKRNHDFWGIFNNASVTLRGEIELTPVEVFKQAAEVNVYGMVRITKAVLPQIRRTKGRIVNMHDMYGRFSVPGCAAYAMTKYAAESFSDALRYEMHQWGVKVSVLEIDKLFAGIHDVISVQDSWDGMTETARRHYGKSYHDDRMACWEREGKAGDNDLRPIVLSAIDGLWSRIPRERYYVGGFKAQLKTYFYSTLPSTMIDKLIMRQYSPGVEQPAALTTH